MHGGFAEWAYAASWDKENVPEYCSGKTYWVNEETNRSFALIVETGEKIPDFDSGGTFEDIFHPESDKAVLGHITRNLRLSLRFSEMMNYYLVLKDLKIKDTNLEI